ncbi:MAG TPA: hypothetical protein VF746_10340 [Longimicrobium sp.]|jgi:hypothetical protein
MQNLFRPPLPAAVAAALLLAAEPARACSLSDFPIVRHPRGAHLIATATAETLEAGAGAVTYRWEQRPGVPNPLPRPIIRGQVVEVERLGGLAAARLGGRVSRAVLVPWGYGADCRTEPWVGNPHWAEPGTRGLFTAMLRDPAHWVDGLPTFDVFNPYSGPYPQRAEAKRYSEDGADPLLLGIDEYFALLDLLPTEEELEASAARAFEPLLAWARRHPELARRYPANALLRFVRHEVGYDRIRNIDPEPAGARRFGASPGGTPPRRLRAAALRGDGTGTRARRRPRGRGRTAPSA